MTRKNLTLEIVENAAANSPSMKAAAEFLGVPYNTFIRYAKKFGVYKPNIGLKGSKKPKRLGHGKKPIEDYLKENVSCNTTTLKLRLIKEGFLKEECSSCHLGPEWNGKKLSLQLDHKDGNRKNNLLSNLRILCPNCHSQTDTFCNGQGKNFATVA